MLLGYKLLPGATAVHFLQAAYFFNVHPWVERRTPSRDESTV